MIAQQLPKILTVHDNQTAQFYEFLGNPVVEIRALSSDGPPSTHFADSEDDFVDCIDSLLGAKGVYTTINRIKPDHGRNIGDDDIERLTTMFVDIDPVRESGTASTDAQHELALAKATQVDRFLRSQGFECIRCDSGNGAYVLFKIDLPPEDAWLVEQFLFTLDGLFSTDQIKIDTCVSNPSRICRVPGTINRKAEPHRECSLLTQDTYVSLVTREQIENVVSHYFREVPAELKPKVESTEAIDLGEVDALEERLIKYMARHGATCTQVVKHAKGGKRVLKFDVCPAHRENHQDGRDGVLIIHGNGSIGFNCFHSKHHGATWADIQEQFGETFAASTFRAYTDPERLAELYLKEITQDGVPSVFTDGREVYGYGNGRWDQSTQLTQACKVRPFIVSEFERIAMQKGSTPKHVSTGLVANVNQSVLSKAYHYVPSEQRPPFWLCQHPWQAADILPLKNGILNLRNYCTEEEFFLPPTPQLFTDSVSEVQYLPDAKCPEFMRFLESLEREPEWYALLQQAFGYTLWQAYHLQKFFNMIGPGGSGKGMLMAILRALVGGSHASINLGNLSDADSFGLETCPGKRLITIPEARMPRDAAQVVDTFKAITGGDPMRINGKNKTPYTHPILGTVWISANRFNAMPDPSNAINRRQIPLQFVKSWSGLPGCEQPDVDLPKKLAAEYPGILNWALAGLRELYSNGGRFTMPESSVALLEESMQQSSPLQKFIAEKCELDPNSCVRTVSAYKVYCDWLGSSTSQLPESDFGPELIAASGYQVEKTRMPAADSEVVRGRGLQATVFDRPGRCHVFVNLKLI